MTPFDRLMNNALGTIDQKRNSVTEASSQKNTIENTLIPSGFSTAASSFSGQGIDTQSELEADMQYLSNLDLQNKYGPSANALIQERDQGFLDYSNSLLNQRTLEQAYKDSTIGFGTGIGSVAHIGTLAAGLISDDAGAAVGGAVDSALDWARDHQSPSLKGSLEGYAARQELSSRDNAAEYEGLERIGADAVSAILNTAVSGESLIDGLAQAGGSLVGGGAIGRAAVWGAKKIPGVRGAMEGSKRVSKAVDSTAMAGVVGSMEGGAAYYETFDRVVNTPIAQLRQTSPLFRKLESMIGDPEEARIRLAGMAGRKAAAITAPVAAATGAVMGRFEMNPMAPRTVTGAAINTVGETIEEGIQGITSPLSTNIALRDYVDPNTDLVAGLGEGAGLGALYGAGVSAGLQTPGVAAQKAYDGAKYVGKKLTARIDSVEQAIKDSAPVSTKELAPKSASINQNLPEIQNVLTEAVSSMPSEQQEQANEFVERLVNLGSFTDGQYQNPVLDAITQGSASKLEALQRIGEVIADPNADMNTRILGALEILLTETNTMALASSDIEAYEQLSDDSPAAQTVNAIVGITQQILNNPEVKDAVEIAQQILEQNAPEIAPVTPESINTPEGQQNINTAIKVAQVAPEKGNLEANQQILYHADNGVIELTDAQRNALNISNAVIKAERVSQSLGKSLGLSEDSTRVNKEITLEGGEKGRSIAQHAKAIYEGLLNNDTEVVAQRMVELGNFAEHMGNKLAALNEHIANGVDTPSKGYDAWNQKARKWFKVEDGSKQALYYDPSVGGSENLVKSVFHEATLAAQIYNNMVDATGQGTKVPMPTQPSVIDSQLTTPSVITDGAAIAPAQPRTDGSIETLEDALIAERDRSSSEIENEWLETGTRRKRTELEWAIYDATAAVVVDGDKAAPLLDIALKNGRLDLAEYIVRRTERYAEGMGTEPGVQPGSPKYDAIKEDLKARKSEATKKAKDLRSKLDEAKGKQPEQPRTDGTTGEAAVAPVVQEVPVLTPEQASRLSDEALANRVQELKDIPVAERTQAQRDTAKVLREEAKSRKTAMERAAQGTRESLKTEAKDTRTTSPEPDVVEDAPVTPSVTAIQAKKLSDPELNDQLNNLLDIPEPDRSPVEAATLDVLDAEMNAREHQAGIDLARQEEGNEQLGEVKPDIVQRAVDVLNSIKNKPHHKYGDTTLKSLVAMYKKGLFEYKVGNTLKQVPFDERIITTALDIYESNIAAWEAAIKAGLDINSSSVSKEHQAILDSAPHTETVEELFTRVAEVYAAQDNKVTQIDPQSISDGKPFNSGKFPLARLGVKKGTPFLNHDICHACSANTAKQLREAGISVANPSISQLDVSGHTDKMGDHKVALVRVNDTAYIVDQPQAEIFAPLSPTEANRMMPQVSEFSPRFIEVTPENLVELYGYTPNSRRLQKAVSKLKGIDSFDAAIPGNIDKVINSISESIGEVITPVEADTVVEPENTINIWHGSNENAELSNLAERPFQFKGVDYFSVEHAYQSLKSGEFDQTTYDKYTGGNQKIAGRKGTKTEGHWNLKLMRALVLESFKQNPEAKKTLLATGDAKFTHTQDKGIWNTEFPRILDNVRKTLREAPDTTPRVSLEGTVVEPTTDTTAVVEPETTTQTPLKGLAYVYQNLIGVVEGINLFVKSFKHPKNQRTRLVGEEQPIEAVLDILNNSLTLSDTLGTKWASRVDDRVLGSWKTLLGKGESISQSVAKRFDAAINHEKVTTNRKTGDRKANPSLLAQLKSGKPVNKYTTGLLFNIAELFTTNKGRETAVLNPELLQLATLAMVDWVINADTNREILDQKKALDTANGMLGTDAISISPEAHAMLNEGTTPEDAIRSLGSKIVKYWGLQEDANGFIGDQQGIPQSLARLFLEDLIQKGHVISNTYVMTNVDGTISLSEESPKSDAISVIKWSVPDNNILGLSEQHVENVIQTRTLLEEIVSLDPEMLYYIGDGAIPPASEHQLRQSLVPLTRQQKAVQKKANATEYRIDAMMVSLYGLIGREQLIEVFGGQNTTQKRLFNKNHLKSVEGQRKSISAAYDALHKLLLEINSVAEAEGKAPEDVAVRFKHEFASVNRLFLQGPYNPQSSKLMRDALLPTWVVADMTQENNQVFFYLALAQGLNISIHKQLHETSIQEVTDLLTADETAEGKPTLKDAVPLVQKMMNQVDTTKLLDQDNRASLDQIRGIFDNAGIPFNFLALKSLMEYVNLTQAEDLTKFKSSLYIEADGMTNGPANAMMLFNSGNFTEHWVQNMERVGFYINQPDATANSKNLSVPDMYQTGANALVRAIEDYKKSLDADWKRTSVDNLHRLISTFNKDFGFNEKEELTVGRSFLKNPLMVMIYGSSPSGVAGSITNALVDSIYERLSEALQRQAQNPEMSFAQAMFPDSANPDQEYGLFEARLGSAIGQKGFRITDPANFTLPTALKTKLKTNIKFNLVDSMYAAIQETVGDTVFANVNKMKTAISEMSNYAALLQKQLIEKQTQLYKDTEQGYTSRQLLKKKDIAKIEEELKRVAAYIESAHQNFLVTDQSTYKVAETTSEGFDGSTRIPGTVQGMAGAGVAGVAYMNQGSGDAQMVQFGYANGGSEMSRVMPAFDGMHFPFTDMEAGGRTMNTAVADSWKLNPMKAVSNAFNRFMEDVNQDLLTEDQREIFPELRKELEHLAAEIQENHDVLSMVPSTNDQMAATGATHQNQGTVAFNSTDIAGITEELNNLKDTVRKQREAAPASVEESPLRKLFAPEGSSITQVRTIFANALPKLLGSNLLDADQKNTLQDILNGKYLAGWSIRIGSPEQLKEAIKAQGITSDELTKALNSGKGGFTIPGSKQIFIMNDSAETVLHEVLHAATFQKVLDHVEGRTNNVAVERIQDMMNLFMELTVDDYGDFASTALQASALQRVIREARSQGNEAVAINEFMAWTLSNRQLTELTKKQTLPKVLQIAKDAWHMLKVLIFGNKHAPKVGTDMYSNLRFNTALIIQSNLSVSELVSSGPTLYHDTSKADPDLVKLDEALQRVIVDQLQMREGVPREHLDKNMLAKEMIIAIQASEAATAAYFNMTNEEAEVFRSVVAALTVEQNLDRDTTREANRLYTHVVRNLKVEDFMEDGADPAERAYANAKYSLVTGASFSEIDGAGRSTALPVFFALAMTNREFKDVLSKMKMPKGMKSEETGVDGVLENFGYKAMDSLGSKLSGTGHATNIQQAMNILGNKLIEQQEARENRLEIPGRWVDKVNDTVVEYANQLANKLTPELTDAEKAQRTKWERGRDGLKSALAIAINEDIGARVAEDVTAATDRKAVQHWARELLADLVGRTSSNALIYDMIKQVRSTVQAIRQNYRVNLPKHIRKQFSRDLTKQEWSSLQKGIAKTDLASLALLGYSKDDIRLWASRDTARGAKIRDLENTLNMSRSGSLWIEKAQQLAKYMITGEKGINLLKNAEAITDVLGTGFTKSIAEGQTREEVVKTIDALVSLYAIDGLNDVDKANLASIVNTEAAGIDYVVSYLTDMVREERSRITPESKYNAYKGFIPFEQKPNTSLIVGHESQHADLITKGYTKVRDFTGANAHMSMGLAYYRMDASAKAAFNQGIIQTAKATTFGVDPNTGYSNSHVVKRITDPVMIRRMLQRQNPENPLVPVYDASGNMIALEQGMQASVLETVRDVSDLAQTIGKWKGRQQEEVLSQEVNKALVDRLKAQFDADPDRSRYENVFASNDPVIKDAVANIPRQTREYIHSVFGKEFLVQKNMLRDVLGYRDASIRDSWTGVTRMPQSTQRAIRNMATLIMKEDAYKYMVRAEEIIENLASNAKVLIAIKSGIVPALNIVSNLVHLVSRGVPINQMRKGIPRKLAEIKEYSESKIRLMKLEADYAAATQANERASLMAQMRAIEDGHRRLSIWPLIEAGEFTAISDVDLRDTDTRITSGKWAEYFDEAVAKLPEGVNTAGRYFLVSKDTALFNGMQKAVEYGDLVAKAILYDDLVARGQKTKEEALGIITEEFVNYDRLPGRARGKLEKMGLLWFYNFKLRSVKVAVSTMRNNPVHTLLALSMPTDFGVGDAGIPIQDNAVTMGLEGRLGYSIGPGQGIRAPSLNPWLNIIN